MSYTIPDYVDTKEQAVLALASTIADEDKSALGDGSVNRALDILADTLAGENVDVPQTNAGAILALASYVKGGGGGGASYDAVIQLTHAENSGGDQAANLTASVVSGTFEDVLSKYTQGGYPRILVQYDDPVTPFRFTTEIVPLMYDEGDNAFIINPVGVFSSQGISDRAVGSMPDPMLWNAEGLSWA